MSKVIEDMAYEDLTGEQTCEFIVKELGLKMTALQFWNASPTGELWHVYEYFCLAKLYKKLREEGLRHE